MVFNHHTDSVRSIVFSPDGNMIYTGSKDKSISVITNGSVQVKLDEAHPAPVHCITHIENGNIIASGDDDGLIKVWDLRMAG